MKMSQAKLKLNLINIVAGGEGAGVGQRQFGWTSGLGRGKLGLWALYTSVPHASWVEDSRECKCLQPIILAPMQIQQLFVF